MTFLKKYLKYKKKYLILKNQTGGATKEEIEAKIKPLQARCSSTSFSQHSGECWSDSIQTLFCYSDATKETVQNKLLNLTPKEIIDLAYYNKRGKFLAPILRRNDDGTKTDVVIKFEKRLEKYLAFLQQRLCVHIEGEKPICKNDKETECFIGDFNKFLMGRYERSGIPKLKKQSSEISGIGTSYTGLKMINRYSSLTYSGGNILDMCIVIHILSFCLLDNNDVVDPGLRDYTDLEKCKDIISDCFGVQLLTKNHATAFYTCDSKDLFYNDNFYIDEPSLKYLIDWRELLYDCSYDDNLHLYVNSNNEKLNLKVDDEYYEVFDKEETKMTSLYPHHNDLIKSYIFLCKDTVMTCISEKMKDMFDIVDLSFNSIDNIKDINKPIVGFDSPLDYSIAMNRPVLLEKLLDAGATINFNLLEQILKKDWVFELGLKETELINLHIADKCKILELIFKKKIVGLAHT